MQRRALLIAAVVAISISCAAAQATLNPTAGEGCVCPALYAPVCIGGRTWSNACMAGCAGVTGPSTPGECGSSSGTGAGDKPVTLPGKTPAAPAPKPCACPMNYAPLCFNGRTYGNRCEAECNGVDVSKATDGECKPTTAPAVPAPQPACPCPKIFAPVCVDGRTFANRCLAECEMINMGRVVEGECAAARPKPSPKPSPKPGPKPSPRPSPRPSPKPTTKPVPKPTPAPSCICTKELDPVCLLGQDYANPCLAVCANPDTKAPLFKGRCESKASPAPAVKPLPVPVPAPVVLPAAACKCPKHILMPVCVGGKKQYDCLEAALCAGAALGAIRPTTCKTRPTGPGKLPAKKPVSPKPIMSDTAMPVPLPSMPAMPSMPDMSVPRGPWAESMADCVATADYNPVCWYPMGIGFPNLSMARCAGVIESELRKGDC